MNESNRDHLHKTQAENPNAYEQGSLTDDSLLVTPNDDPTDEPETTPSNIISRSITSLIDMDRMVHSLLTSKIQNGFFDKPQPKNVINHLVDHIIEIISRAGGENED